MVSISVERLLKEGGNELRLRFLAGTDFALERRIGSARIQKPGLALTGHTEGVHSERLAVFGNTEVSFAQTLDEATLREGLRHLFSVGISALVITKDLPVPPALLEEADRAQIAVLSTPLLSSTLIGRVTRFLEDALAPSTSLHGVLIDVLGVGILIMGKSGIGKSEVALDLVLRGHRLVADDIVDIKRQGRTLYGQPSELIKHHLEIRGLGIVNVKDLFGIAAVRERKKIELVVELVEWDPGEIYDRLGLDEQSYEILDEPLPLLTVPVRPGRSMTTLIEVAARNHLLKLQGHHSAKAFQRRLDEAIAEAGFGARAAPGEDVE